MRIVIADDHPLYLEAVRIETEKTFSDCTVSAVTSMDAAMDCLDRHPGADLILADYSMPGMHGPEGVAKLVERAATAPVVVISGVADPAEVGACIRAGARGFLPKTMAPDQFSAALQIIVSGGSYIPVEYVRALSAPPERQETKPGDFTDRELEILRMVVEGQSNKEIARMLSCQEVTIKVNLTRIFGKLGAKNRTQAAMIAVNQRFFSSA